MKKIFISTGGTGGHIFPAIALSLELQKQEFEVYLISDQRFKNYPIREEAKILKVFFLNISSPIKRIKFIYSTLLSILKMVGLFWKFKPDLVIGFGGYFTIPTLVVAVIFRTKYILHEANSILGKVNKMFLPLSHYLTLGMPLRSLIEYERYILTGNPTLSNFFFLDYPKLESNFNILILGGSQGASVMTKYASRAIVEVSKNSKYKIEVFHQSPKEEIEENKNIYLEAGIKAEVTDFFINVEKKIAASHLIISRAGAGTISEINVIGRPAIYIPYPRAAENHQLFNAEHVKQNGAGFIVYEDDVIYSSLIETITYLMNSLKILQISSENAANLSRKDARLEMINVIKEVIGNDNGG